MSARTTLGQKIARHLFTVGGPSPIRADRLRSFLGGKYLAGWAEGPMANRIDELLKTYTAPARAKKGKRGDRIVRTNAELQSLIDSAELPPAKRKGKKK